MLALRPFLKLTEINLAPIPKFLSRYLGSEPLAILRRYFFFFFFFSTLFSIWPGFAKIRRRVVVGRRESRSVRCRPRRHSVVEATGRLEQQTRYCTKMLYNSSSSSSTINTALYNTVQHAKEYCSTIRAYQV